jgi:hypothetical protein
MYDSARWREKRGIGSAWPKRYAVTPMLDMEHLFIDSTIVRAHQHSAGAQKKPGARKSVARGVG